MNLVLFPRCAAALALSAATCAQQFQTLSGDLLPPLQDLTVWAHACADIDGDGDQDLVLGGASTLAVLRNLGALHFARVAVANNTDWVYGLALFDADRDGDQDLYVARGGYDSFYLNDGTGSFTLASGRFPAVFDSSRGALPVDVDRDGDLDLVVINVVTSSYVPGNRLYLNNGSGTFSDASSRLPAAASTLAVDAGDIDGDGDVDLLFGNDGTDTLARNDGNGNFQAVAPVPWDNVKTVGVALRDFDGDGDRDVLAAIELGAALRLFVNDGAGNFVDGGSGRLPADPNRSLEFDVGDLDGDGDLDLALGSYVRTTTTVLRNDGAGWFSDATAQWVTSPGNGVWATDVLLRDFDGDADLELWQSGNFPTVGHLLLTNDGGERFVAAQRRVLPAFNTFNVAEAGFADFDGDRRTDLFIGGVNVLMLQRSDGTFVDRSRLDIPSLGTSNSVAIGDVDGDGDLDIALGAATVARKQLLRNDGTGHFTDVTATHLPSATDTTYDVQLADTDGDGDLDLVCAVSLNNQSRHYRNDGTGHFTDVTETTLPILLGLHKAVAPGDVDRDGDIDLVFASESNPPEPVRMYRNDGTGRFTDTGPLPNASYLAYDAELRDVDGDGDLDLLVAHAQGLALHRNDGGVFTDVTATHVPAVGAAYRVDAGDIDADGDLDVMCGRLLVNDGTGRFTDQTSRLTRIPGAGHFSLGDLDDDGDADLLDSYNAELQVNLWQHTFIPEAAVLGGTLQLRLYAEPGVASQPVPIAPFLAPSLATTPIALPGLGRVWLEPTALVPLPVVAATPPSGLVTVALPVPDNRNLAGLSLFVQTVVAHGNGQSRLSNTSGVTLIR